MPNKKHSNRKPRGQNLVFSNALLERTVNASKEFRDRVFALVANGWDHKRNCAKVSRKVKGVHPRPLNGVYLWWPRMSVTDVPKDDERKEFIASVQFGEFPLTNNGLVFAFLVLECAGRLLNPDGFKRNLSDELIRLAGPDLLALVFRHLAAYSLQGNVKNLHRAAKEYGTQGVVTSFSALFMSFSEGDDAERSVALTYLLKTMYCQLVEPSVRPAKLIPVKNIPESVPCNKVLVAAYIRTNVGERTPRRSGTFVVYPDVKNDGHTMFAFGDNLQTIQHQTALELPELQAAGLLDKMSVLDGYGRGWMSDACVPKPDEH